MALRKTNSTSETAPTSIGYYIEVVTKTPFKSISNQPFCVWQYRIRFLLATQPSTNYLEGLRDQKILTSDAPPHTISVRVGLEFSSRIDIKLPALYPECQPVQGTSVSRATTGTSQYVWQQLQVQRTAPDHIDLFFIAPCEEDLFTPVHLAFSPAEGAPWIDFPFQVAGQSSPCRTQVLRGPAIVAAAVDCPQPPDSPKAPDFPPTKTPSQPSVTPPQSVASPLEASARQVLKGTLVKIKSANSPIEGNGLAKYSFVRQLSISSGDTHAVAQHLKDASSNGASAPISASTFSLLRSFEQPVVPGMRPNIAAVANVPSDELTTFANALVSVRNLQLAASRQEGLGMPHIGAVMQSLNSAVVAARGYAINTAAQPIGMLNLERIEMVPAGIQRGELVATIPLAPGEETAVTHKEWSVTSKEFTTIVTDSLEQTSETGVTDNTDLSQATTSQTQHSTQFNITGTVQGGIPMINGSSTAGVTAQDGGSQSATDSVKHATSVTQKASARSRQEHKTTISTTTVTGSAESSTRVMKNVSTTDPIRIDYFSLMRKWRVRLYRFGLRLTYDLVVPEPGAAMRRAYVELNALKDQIGPFVFDVKYTDLTNEPVNKDTGKPPAPGDQTIPKYLWYADQVRTSVPPYPADPSPITADVTGDGAQEWVKLQLEFDVPAGSAIKQVFLDCNINRDPNGGGMILHILGTQFWPAQLTDAGTQVILTAHLPLFDAPGSSKPFLAGRTGHQKIYGLVNDGERIILQLTVELENLPSVIESWRADAWNALYNAAQTRYFGQQQQISSDIAAIEARLTSVDTLTLRREESDEVMKSILKFVLGNEFNLMPSEVEAAFKSAGADLNHGIAFDGPTLSGLGAGQWSVLRQHEDIVRFINQAIEWENVVTFLYSYFWDLPQSWTFIRELRHPDPNRQAFLRAGSARVVLTVRKGWEAKWMQFTQDGTVDAELASPITGPYLTIAQEIAAYDDRNYPGIPPANPARAAVRLQDSVYTTSSGKIDPGPDAVTMQVASSSGFVVGLRVVLDVEDDRHIQEAVVINDIPDQTHITVAKIAHTHDGTQEAFPVLQPGDKGALIAEWDEYTPSSGTDIAVTSNLATIA